MTCQEAIAILSDYLEATLARLDLEQLEEHLADCAPCRAYLATYRRTIEVGGAAGRVEMPDEMKARLRTFLSSRLPRDS
jgi:predicted anti-sigma-YlaC factor YlaD